MTKVRLRLPEEAILISNLDYLDRTAAQRNAAAALFPRIWKIERGPKRFRYVSFEHVVTPSLSEIEQGD